MDLVQIDGLNAQPAQTLLCRLLNVLAREATAIRALTVREVDLGGEHDFVEGGELPQPPAGDFLAHPHGVHVGGVEYSDAEFDGPLEERSCRLAIHDPGTPVR